MARCARRDSWETKAGRESHGDDASRCAQSCKGVGNDRYSYAKVDLRRSSRGAILCKSQTTSGDQLLEPLIRRARRGRERSLSTRHSPNCYSVQTSEYSFALATVAASFPQLAIAIERIASLDRTIRSDPSLRISTSNSVCCLLPYFMKSQTCGQKAGVELGRQFCSGIRKTTIPK